MSTTTPLLMRISKLSLKGLRESEKNQKKRKPMDISPEKKSGRQDAKAPYRIEMQDRKHAFKQKQRPTQEKALPDFRSPLFFRSMPALRHPAEAL